MRTIIFVTFLALSVATCMVKSQTTNINLKPTLSEALDNPTIGRQLKDFTGCTDVFHQVGAKTDFHSAKLVSQSFSTDIQFVVKPDTLSEVRN